MEEQTLIIEDEAMRCWKEIFPLGWSNTSQVTLTYDQHIAFAKHYADWQKKRLLKDAVEGTIGFVSIRLDKPNFSEDYKEGDKVKVILIKDEP